MQLMRMRQLKHLLPLRQQVLHLRQTVSMIHRRHTDGTCDDLQECQEHGQFIDGFEELRLPTREYGSTREEPERFAYQVDG